MNNHILLDFDLFIDTDVGILKTIFRSYNDKNAFKQYLFKDDLTLRSVLHHREVLNPLELITKDEFISESDDLYKQIIEKEEESIIECSSNNNCTKLIKSFAMTNLIYITIRCKNIHEERYIKSLFKGNDKVSTIVETDISKIDISIYDILYIKNIRDCLLYKDLKSKNIYIPDYGFNLEKNITAKDNPLIPLMEVSITIGDVNKIYIINLYSDTFIIKG